MRFGVVTTSYPRHPGEAAGSFVAELNDWLRARGHEISVLAAGSGSEDESWQPVPVARVPASAGLFYRGGAPDALRGSVAQLQAALFSARLTIAARRHLRDCDGVIAHWLVPCAVAAVLVGKDKPIWAMAHGGDVHLIERLGLGPLLTALFDRPNVHLNFVSRAAREVFAKAAGERGRLLVERSSVCSMGVDLARLQALSRQPRDASPATHVVFIGRLVAIKGVDLLLEALAKISDAFTLSIAGAGPEEFSLRAQADKLGVPVKWLGEIGAADRDALLGSADVVVLPSREDGDRQEGMPLVALEALAAGAQLIAARSGGLAEIPESICFPIPMDDAPALAGALQRVLKGERAPCLPGHWIEERDWHHVAPRLLPGASL